MDIQKGSEDFIIKSSNNKHLKVIGEYVNAHTDVLCECVYCGDTFKMRPERIYKNCMHQKCRNILTASIRKERGFKKLLEIAGENIEFTTEYIASNRPIGCRCKRCGHEFVGYPHNLNKGVGCPKCFRKSKMKSVSKFLDEIREILPNIDILSEYTGDSKRIRCRCKIDGYEWSPFAGSLIQGHGCPMCAGNARYGFNYFASKLERINPNIEASGEYINAQTHINCLCKICGYEWMAKPNNLLSGKGCPHCRSSKAEDKVKNFLKSKEIRFETQKKYEDLIGVGNGYLSYDFYIPEHNLLIEAQGEQHYAPVDFFGGQEQFKIQQEHDKRKRDYANTNNIRLLEIPYSEFENIEEFLQSVL